MSEPSPHQPDEKKLPPAKRGGGHHAELGGENIQCRVLIVDDNAAVVKMLGLLMKLLGNEVRTAGDGDEGITVAAEFLPDVVLMDLGMPRMNGFDAARQIRQQSWGERMLLVAVSGWDASEARQRTKEVGFDHHLVKPADALELQRLIQGSNNNPKPRISRDMSCESLWKGTLRLNGTPGGRISQRKPLAQPVFSVRS